MALLRAAETGHPGVIDVLARAKADYVATVAADRGGASIAQAEFDRFTAWGAAKVLATPGQRADRGCDCPAENGSTAPVPTIDDEEARLEREATRAEAEPPPGAEALDDVVTPSWRTLADIDASPSGPLLLGMLEPDGPTLLYGAGGTGKGMSACWMMRELIKLGMRPLVYDAENRPKEWARRAEGLGIDRGRIVYVQPKDLPKELRGKPPWEVVPHLARIARAAGCDIMFIDSILAAMNVGEDRLRSDAGAPYQYVSALDNLLELPSVSIGHTPKNSPEGDPYGSVSWINAMRLTWLGTTAQGDGHRIRWRPRKRNERGRIDPVQLVFSYDEQNRPRAVEQLDDERSTREWITLALMLGEATVEGVAEAMVSEGDE